MLNADIALNPIVEDWVESYQKAANDEAGEKEAVQELILFVIRCCGLQADVDADEAMDMDGIADAVETIEEESARVSSPRLLHRSRAEQSEYCRDLPPDITHKDPQTFQVQSQPIPLPPHPHFIADASAVPNG
jgi:hypothetical protein